jgi:hypothetical protein
MQRRGVVSIAEAGLVYLAVLVSMNCSTEPGRQFTINVVATPKEGGTASGGGSFSPGSTVTLTAQPKAPYTFGGWRRDDVIIASLSTTYTFVDSIDHKFEALFLAPFRADIIWPRPLLPVPDTIELRVKAVSPRAVASVRAEVAGIKTALTLRSGGDWDARIDISKLPLDTLPITVVVTDVAGDTATSVTRVLHDRLPTIDLVAPLNETVARPQLSYSATCTDDFPGCTISIFDGFPETTPPLVTGTGKISGTLSLAVSEGKRVSLVFVARDSRFQTRSVARTIYVESSQQLDSIGSVPTPFWDVDVTRALFGKTDTPTVTLRTWPSGVDERIITSFVPGSARLTPYGAIVSKSFGESIDWRGGTATHVSGVVNEVVGQYARFSEPAKNRTYFQYRYDLATRFTVLVGEFDCCGASLRLSANGDVIIAGVDGALRRYRNGILSKLPGEPPSTLGDSLPLVDGEVVVYRKTSPGIFAETYQIAMNDGSKEIVLGPPRSQNSSPLSKILPGQDYAVNNGWVAFTQSNASMQRQVWLRSPSGELRQVSPVGIDVLISAVGPDGTVVFTAGGRRFLIPPNGVARDVGGSHGTVQFFSAQPYLILGRSFWRIR